MKRILLLFLFALVFSTTATAQDKISLKGKELFGGLEARQIGPALMSGRIIDVENQRS